MGLQDDRPDLEHARNHGAAASRPLPPSSARPAADHLHAQISRMSRGAANLAQPENNTCVSSPGRTRSR